MTASDGADGVRGDRDGQVAVAETIVFAAAPAGDVTDCAGVTCESDGPAGP